MARKQKKVCESCGRKPRIRGERYCTRCRYRLLTEMKHDGYLQPISRTPYVTSYGDRLTEDDLDDMLKILESQNNAY